MSVPPEDFQRACLSASFFFFLKYWFADLPPDGGAQLFHPLMKPGRFPFVREFVCFFLIAEFFPPPNILKDKELGGVPF